VLPTIIELYAGADHQVLNRARRYDFIGSGRVCHASGDVHGHSRYVVAPSLDLSRVYARPNAEPEVVSDTMSDSASTFDRTGRAVEGGQRPIASSFYVDATKALKMVQDKFVIAIERLPPAPIAQSSSMACRLDDVCKKHRSQDPVQDGDQPGAGDEVLCLVEQTLEVSGEGRMVISR
jgi:hypothetical protein